MSIAATFDLPPEKALKFFRAKGLKAGFAWQDVWQQEHDAAFTVAKMADTDLLQDVKDALDKSLASGTTFAEFKKLLIPIMQQKGWWGVQEKTDPLDGKTKLVQLGSPRRLQTIFRTNMRMAHAAGDWEKIKENESDAPFLMYDAIDDNHTRPEHKAWDGIVLPVNDSFWHSHRPPNGWNCRCSVIQINNRELKRLGKSGADDAPKIEKREYVNKRTGEVMLVPKGIDPGFEYNPGESRQAHLNATLKSKTKLLKGD